MPVKRRTLWFTDEAWDTIRENAAKHGMNPSAYVSAALAFTDDDPKMAARAALTTGVGAKPINGLSQAERDRILRRISQG